MNKALNLTRFSQLLLNCHGDSVDREEWEIHGIDFSWYFSQGTNIQSIFVLSTRCLTLCSPDLKEISQFWFVFSILLKWKLAFGQKLEATIVSQELRVLTVRAQLKVWWNQGINARWEKHTPSKRFSVCLVAKFLQFCPRCRALVMVWTCIRWCIGFVYRFLTVLHHRTWVMVISFGLPSSTITFWTWIHLQTYSETPVAKHFLVGSFYASKFSLLQSDYTGPIVLSSDTNAYLAISFICNSPWVMTMKSYDGWQSFDPVVKTHKK